MNLDIMHLELIGQLKLHVPKLPEQRRLLNAIDANWDQCNELHTCGYDSYLILGIQVYE